MFMHVDLPVRMMSSQFSTALTIAFALFFIISELVLYKGAKTGYRSFEALPSLVKYPVFAGGLLLIALFGVSRNSFIYFHF